MKGRDGSLMKSAGAHAQMARISAIHSHPRLPARLITYINNYPEGLH
jgi:hypothetical protein